MKKIAKHFSLLFFSSGALSFLGGGIIFFSREILQPVFGVDITGALFLLFLFLGLLFSVFGICFLLFFLLKKGE